MNIAITGAEGFLGTHLVKTLQSKNIQCSVFNRSKHNLFIVDSLKDFVSSKDVIVHLAGINRDKNSNDIANVNILGTLGLLEALVKYSPHAKFIFSSSIRAQLQNDVYGISKRIAEELIIGYAKKYGFSVGLLRFSNLYGAGGMPFYNSVISTMMHQIKQGETIAIHGDGSQERDYLYVQDAVTAIIAAIHCKSLKAIPMNICTGVLTSLNEILEILKMYSRNEIRVRYDTIAKTENVHIKPRFTQASKILNWHPNVSIQEGLRMLLREEKI